MTILESNHVGQARDIAQACDALRRELRRAVERSGIVSIRTSAPAIDCFGWLAAQSGLPRFYFADRSQHEEVAAIGIAIARRLPGTATMADVRQMLDDAMPLLSDGRRLYGGVRFDPSTAISPEWEPFGAAMFVLPRLELRRTGSRSEIWVHANSDDEADVEAALEAIDALAERQSDRPSDIGVDATVRRNSPDYPAWLRAMDDVLSEIRTGRIEKAVLARAASFARPGLSPIALFERVPELAPHCFHVYFEPEYGSAFLSATPERLFRRSGDRLISEAVAGTRPRGTAAEDDARLRDELLSSEKDRREHAVVGRSIIQALEPMCSKIDLETTPTEMRLRGNRHLKSVVRATLEPGVTNGRLLEALHPTPAVGGWPTREALALIDSIEPFDRGWYAGAIGWLGEQEAELAVGIRSALVTDDALTLYSGAGIVEGSEADAEWSEIEQKLETFLNVIATPIGCNETIGD